LKAMHAQVTSPVEQPSRWTPCAEKADRFCPEGTSAVKKRTFNKVAAMSGASIAYPGSTALSVLIGAIVGGALHGPAGIITGFGAALAINNMSPISSLSAGATFFIAGAGMGSFECACWPRACLYDEKEQKCTIGEPHMAASKNPFARALPYQGLKCVPHRKKAGVCRFEACNADDFKSSRLQKRGVHGTVGLIDGGLHNCLSTSSFPTDSLELAQVLPNGRNNTAEARAAFFAKIGVRPYPDA